MTAAHDSQEIGDRVVALTDRLQLPAELIPDQIRALADASGDRLTILGDRLLAAERFLSLPRPARTDAAREAVGLGMATESFYRMLRNMRANGPVRGALVHLGRKAKHRLTKDGLGDAGEAALKRALAEQPAARLSDIVEEVRSAVAQAGDTMPSAPTIRIRVQAMRPRVPPRALLAGREMLLVTRNASDFYLGAPSSSQLVTLLIDEESRLILGADHDVTPARSIEDCIDDGIGTRIRELAYAGVPFAQGRWQIQWQVAEGIDADTVGATRDSAAAMGMQVRLSAAGSDPLADILRPASLSALRLLRDNEQVLRHATTGPDQFNSQISAAVSKWNMRIISLGRPRAKKDVDDGRTLVHALQRGLRPPIHDLAVRERKQSLSSRSLPSAPS